MKIPIYDISITYRTFWLYHKYFRIKKPFLHFSKFLLSKETTLNSNIFCLYQSILFKLYASDQHEAVDKHIGTNTNLNI